MKSIGSGFIRQATSREQFSREHTTPAFPPKTDWFEDSQAGLGRCQGKHLGLCLRLSKLIAPD